MKKREKEEIFRKLNGINLQLFAQKGEGGEGGDGGDEGGDDGAEGGDGGDEGGKGGEGGDGGDDGDKRTVPYKRFKAVNKEKKDLQTENTTLKSDLEEARNLLKGKETADTALKTDNENLKSQLLSERLRNSFIAESLRQGIQFHDIDDAIRLADFTDVAIDEKGRVDKDDMIDMVKEFVKRKPHLLKTAEGSPNFPGKKPPKSGGDGGKTPEELAREKAKARAEKKYGAPSNDPWKK